ncbi:MAG: aspartate aminotransferase family protein [Verrucomicrobiota bacterium]
MRKKIATNEVLRLLRQYESRNVTFMETDGSWPIVFERAQGVHVWDAAGRKYLDLTAAFGVAAAGHANPRVVAAGRQQMGRLLHAMGDVHPHAPKALLARELSRLTYERWARVGQYSPQVHGKVIFCNSGFEAVEAALKTAFLLTKRKGVIAFKGAYHGLGYGALNATHRRHFRQPFLPQIKQFGRFLTYPACLDDLLGVEAELRACLNQEPIGAVLVEPVQARGGIQVPPLEFFPVLRTLCSKYNVALIFDEIYTGFGRTGRWFACEHTAVVPDLICVGKAMAGGFPISACVGRADYMDLAWPESNGEAIHTSTFLGHPVGCRMALAQIAELQARHLPERSAKLGAFALQELQALARHLQNTHPKLKADARGQGLMLGLELQFKDGTPATQLSLAVIKDMLQRGYILLPEGEHANVISLTPPLTITQRQLKSTIAALGTSVRDCAARVRPETL